MISPRTIAAVLLATTIATVAMAQTGATRQPKVQPKIGAAPAPVGMGPKDGQVDDVRPYLEGLFKKIQPRDIDPKLLKELIEKMPKDQKVNPKQVEEILKNNQRFKDPEFLNQLEKLLNSKDFKNDLEQKLPQDGPRPPIGDELHGNLEQVVQSGKTQIGPDMPKDVTGAKPDGKLPNLPKDGPDSKSAAADNEWVKWMEKNFGKSQAAEGAVKDLISAMEKNKGKGMFDDIPEFKNGGWKDMNNWGKSNAGELWKLKPPSTQGGNITSPKIGGGGGGANFGGGGGGSGFGGGGGGGGGFWWRRHGAGRYRRHCRGDLSGRLALAQMEVQRRAEGGGRGRRRGRHRLRFDQVARATGARV